MHLSVMDDSRKMSLMQGSAAFATAVQVLIAEDTSNVQGATPKTVIVSVISVQVSLRQNVPPAGLARWVCDLRCYNHRMHGISGLWHHFHFDCFIVLIYACSHYSYSGVEQGTDLPIFC